MKVIISLSDKPNKRYTAIFYDNDKKVKTTHFGYKIKMDLEVHI
jgi:phage-related protein